MTYDLFCSDDEGAAPTPADQTDGLPVVVAYGMGTDSTAMLIGMHQMGWRPDLILFANTGSEMPHTYAYLPVIQDWLASVGFPSVTIVKNASPVAGDQSLYDECHRKSVLPSLAYGGHSCSLKWKVTPQDRFCREHFGWRPYRRGEPKPPSNGQTPPGRWDHGLWLLKLIGYDAGPADARRIKNAAGKWPPGYKYRYPLQEWGWNRDACEREILAVGLPLPGKSSCFMCPAMKRHEVDALDRNNPEMAEAAMELESRAIERGLRSTKGLGRNWSWTDRLRGGGCAGPLFRAA